MIPSIVKKSKNQQYDLNKMVQDAILEMDQKYIQIRNIRNENYLQSIEEKQTNILKDTILEVKLKPKRIIDGEEELKYIRLNEQERKEYI